MAKDPAFLFYPADFMIGTALMSHDQRGKYVTLLCYQHQLGHLKKEDIVAVCGEDEKIFSKFDKDEDGLFFNKRLEEEKVKRTGWTQSRIDNLNSKRKNTAVKDKEEPKEVKKFNPPTLDEVKTYCKERGNKVDPQYFIDRNSAIGWVDKNGNKYKDWKAVVRNWESWSKATTITPTAGKRPAMIVVCEKIAAGLDDREILHDMVCKYTEHEINEALMAARGNKQ